jgi:RNA polymerase sigma factor (sigma-70 family)
LIDFEDIYNGNYEKLFRVALKMVGNKDSAGDIVQDVFVNFYTRQNDGHLILYPSSWLYKVVINKSLDFLKHAAKFQTIKSEENEKADEPADEKEQRISFSSMPYLNSIGLSSPPQVACVSDKLIVSIPGTGEILTYSLTGEPVSKSRINWTPGTISVDEQKEIQRTAIENYKNEKFPAGSSLASPDELKNASNQIVQQMQSDLGKISDPIPIPSFSTIIKDSDGNLLYFEYPKKEFANKFNVWILEKSGRFVCQSSFVCEDYELNINPSKMVFRDGYIYGLQILKKASGVPLRLVRFKVSN